MIETINGKAYVKKGDKVYEVGGGGGTDFIFANSKEELPDPSTVPENSVGLVPSEGNAGGGGLPVVELTTMPSEEGNALTAEENAKLLAVAGSPVIIKNPNIVGVFNYYGESGAYHSFFGMAAALPLMIQTGEDPAAFTFTIMSAGG